MPRRSDRPLDRDLIAACALALFREGGLAAVTTRRVASALGVSPMALYVHVGNKEGLLDAVVAVEQRAYSHPWSRGNFADALAVGYQAQCLMAGDDDALIGYFIAMKGVDEVHLLNITVAPEFQRQGWAVLMLDALALWARRRPPLGNAAD